MPNNFDLEAFDYQPPTSDDPVECFKVRVAASPMGEQRVADAERVTLAPAVRSSLVALQRNALPLPDLIAFGEHLAAALLPPGVRHLLDQSRASVASAHDPLLRLRLKLDAFRLANLPWEYLYLADASMPPDQRGIDGFVALDPRYSLVRYEALGQPIQALDPAGPPPLRLVALLADPGRSDTGAAWTSREILSTGVLPADAIDREVLGIDASGPGASDPDTPELDVPLHVLQLVVERRAIAEALAGVPGITVESPSSATVGALHDALLPGAHFFHFAGHGIFHRRSPDATTTGAPGRGYLVLLDDAGRPAPLDVDTLALNLRGRNVRLAVLGACGSGRRDGVNAWTGIAPALTRAGIPAVVAMQDTIRDENAIAFSRALYRALAAGQSIDRAVTEGRLAIVNRGRAGGRDWGTPVLYLRLAGDGVIIPAGAGSQGSGPRVAATPPRPGAAPAGCPPPPASLDKRALREAMIDAFSVTDLETLCADIEQDLREVGIDTQVNLEVVGGTNKPAQALNLINFFDRRGWLGCLVRAVERARPGWSENKRED